MDLVYEYKPLQIERERLLKEIKQLENDIKELHLNMKNETIGF